MYRYLAVFTSQSQPSTPYMAASLADSFLHVVTLFSADNPPQRGPTVTPLGYWPALDTMRTVAMAAVVIYHASLLSHVRGAGFAVSLFFTLSGFLMGTILISELVETGNVRVLRFWGRRFRRLMPAAVGALALVVLYAAFVASPEQLLRVRADVLATIAYVVNIRFAIVGRSYVDGNVNPTPVLTFWSLSLEEQFYFVLPLILSVIAFMGTRRYRRPSRLETIGHVDGLSDVNHSPATAPRRPARTVLAVSAALCVACTVWMAYLFSRGAPIERLYYSPEGRFAECFAGVALAAYRIDSGGFPRRLVTWCNILTPVILASFVWLWITVDAANDAAYQGGFLVNALATCIVLVACTTVGPISRILGWRPLSITGRYSYGMYVYHWPITLLLATSSLALRGWQLILATIAITAVVSVLSYHLIESPIRYGKRIGPVAIKLLGITATIGMVGATIAATSDPPDARLNFDRIEDPALGTASAKETVMVVGDSLSSNLAHGLFATKPDGVAILDRTTPGCGLATGERRTEPRWVDQAGKCDGEWKATYRSDVEAFQPRIVLAMWGIQDIWDRRVNGTVVPFDSPAGRALREREITEAVDALSNANTTVVLITTPTVAWEGWGAVMIEDPKRSVNNPDWIALWNESIRNVARSHPDSTAVIDLNEEITPNNAFVTEIDGIVFRMFDGLHITRGGQRVAANWIWSEIDGFLK